ncbi:hypothetical protein AB4124_05880 [Paenibacillus sp. 2KB_20]|uniref:hypothetical protein n=1 Tax=Paenibacillus sp. 2KB_20 TaxID=3232977 RepID=UPI003F970E1E
MYSLIKNFELMNVDSEARIIIADLKEIKQKSEVYTDKIAEEITGKVVTITGNYSRIFIDLKRENDGANTGY